jgi:DNA-binding XRE family transcriptional regulator
MLTFAEIRVSSSSSFTSCWLFSLALVGREKALNMIKNLRLEAKLSLNHLARLADLDRATVSKAEKGGVVSELTIHKMASALSQELGRPLSPDELIVG